MITKDKIMEIAEYVLNEYLCDTHSDAIGIFRGRLDELFDKDKWKEKYEKAFNEGKLYYLHSNGQWHKSHVHIYLSLDYEHHNEQWFAERYRIAEPGDLYKEFNDAIDNGITVQVRDGGQWFDADKYATILEEYELCDIRIKPIVDPYAEFREAEQDPYKVVEYRSQVDNKWCNVDKNNLSYFFPPERYRIREYIPFDKSDLKKYYGADVIDIYGRVGKIGICLSPDLQDNKIIYFYGEYYSFDGAHRNFRFYDSTKDKFEDMPIFGKLKEIE